MAKTPAPNRTLASFSLSILPKSDYPLSEETETILDSIFSYVKERFDTERSIPPLFKETALLWQEIMSIDGAKEQGKLAYGEKPVRPIRSF